MVALAFANVFLSLHFVMSPVALLPLLGMPECLFALALVFPAVALLIQYFAAVFKAYSIGDFFKSAATHCDSVGVSCVYQVHLRKLLFVVSC